MAPPAEAMSYAVSSTSAPMADQGSNRPKDEVTPEALFHRRREFLKDSLLFTATSVGVGLGLTS
jgi:hypothetical protein